MKCFICNGNTTKTTSRYTIRDNNHFHTITIPCLKCEQCGECYIDGCTLQNIKSTYEVLTLLLLNSTFLIALLTYLDHRNQRK